tara:strand:- start:96 stop:674 length:579 start_codon:yes stop_codon:yes gene_type:complete
VGKKGLQLFLFVILILISIFFYYYYFDQEKKDKVIETNNTKENLSDIQNNLIKNLKYEVKFDNNTQYIITADLSEIIYENDIEIVKMQSVEAKFIDDKNNLLVITSKNANYNNNTYDTEFLNNVKIKYMDNTIMSENLDMKFTENIISIYNNVVYDGLQGFIKTDNILINLKTKNIEMFMNNLDNKIEGISK